MSTIRNPVWDLYNEIRTARLNCKYYTHRLCTVERTATIIDIVLAIAAPTSAVSVLKAFETPQGQLIWGCFTGAAALLAVIKPFLQLPAKIKTLESVVSGYRLLESELQEICTDVSQSQLYLPEHRALLVRALRRKQVLDGQQPKAREDKKLKLKCEDEVREELPASAFFIPPHVTQPPSLAASAQASAPGGASPTAPALAALPSPAGPGASHA
jgi:hypothetical protein